MTQTGESASHLASEFRPSSLPSARPTTRRDAFGNEHPITPKPVTELLTQFQAAFKSQTDGLLLSDPKFQTILNTYTSLNHHAAIERIAEACDLAGQSSRLPPLIRELNKAQALQERAAARFSREQAARDKEQRRIEREADRKADRTGRDERKEALADRRMKHKERMEELKLARYYQSDSRKAKAQANRDYRDNYQSHKSEREASEREDFQNATPAHS